MDSRRHIAFLSAAIMAAGARIVPHEPIIEEVDRGEMGRLKADSLERQRKKLQRRLGLPNEKTPADEAAIRAAEERRAKRNAKRARPLPLAPTPEGE